MRLRTLLHLLLIGGGLAATSPLCAQSIVSGQLSGNVERSDGGSVSQALLTLRALDRGVARVTVADATGRFSFGLVEPGAYELRAEAIGFRPVVAIPVHVGAGDATSLTLQMQPAEPPVTTVDTMALPSASPSSWRGTGFRVGSSRIATLPDAYEDVAAVVALSSRNDAALGSEGLPGDLSLLVADGVPFHSATHPAMRGESLSTPLFSRVAFSSLDVWETPPDIEWAGSASALLAITSRSAVGVDGTALGGSWSGDPLWSSSTLEFEAPALTSYWASAAASLDISPDTSRVFVAGEALQLDAPLGPRLTPDAAGLLQSLDPGVAEALTVPAVERTRRASGLARLDWSLGTTRRIMLRAGAGRLQRDFDGFGPATLGYGGAPPETATDFSLAGNMVTSYGRGVTVELRGGVSGSNHAYAESLPGVPTTMLVGTGVAVGGPTSAADVSRIDVDFSPVVHLPLGPGLAKGGVTVLASRHALTWDPWTDGRYVFTDPAAAAAGRGAFVRSSAVPESSFSTTDVGLFGQYAWNLAPGLRASLGGRFDYQWLSPDQISLSNVWQQVSGVSNRLTPSGLSKWGTVGSLTWDLQGNGRTILDGAIALTHGEVDPAVLHEVYTHDGNAKVTRYVGKSLPWPSGAVTSGSTFPTLSILGPDSRAPRSTRASVGLVHHAPTGWSLFVGAVSRRTDFLPRRRDLNLAVFPLATGPHGRDILGDLKQEGAVVVSDPGSDRRFSSFDAVWAIDTDGWSEYLGVSAGVEHQSPMLDLFASYTRSQTRDNWIGAAAGVPEAQLSPGLPGFGDWTEGTSDFDVPDRLVAGFTVGLGPDRIVSATGVLRYESGLPFTPGYRAGVDINGDGSVLNDVAWVPEDAISALGSEWPCLTERTNEGFAIRNGCRGPARTGLDVRVRARLASVGGRRVELTVDAYNLVETEEGIRDTALLLVDPSGSITTSSDGSTVTVPVTTNPDFGQILVPTNRGRMIRLGLRIGGAP